MAKKKAGMYSGVDLNKEEEEFENGEKVADNDNGQTLFDFTDDEEEEIPLSEKEKVFSDGDFNDLVDFSHVSSNELQNGNLTDQSDVLVSQISSVEKSNEQQNRP